jgi:hypothetical protein
MTLKSWIHFPAHREQFATAQGVLPNQIEFVEFFKQQWDIARWPTGRERSESGRLVEIRHGHSEILYHESGLTYRGRRPRTMPQASSTRSIIVLSPPPSLPTASRAIVKQSGHQG